LPADKRSYEHVFAKKFKHDTNPLRTMKVVFGRLKMTSSDYDVLGHELFSEGFAGHEIMFSSHEYGASEP